MNNKNLCFAYYGDGLFLGWYADTFGSIRKYPKVYTNSQRQRNIIEENFTSKMKRIADTTNEVEKIFSSVNPIAGALIGDGLSRDEEKLIDYKKIELRMVECPFYDGPNPDYDEKVGDEWRERYVNEAPEDQIERYEWAKENKPPEASTWTYATNDPGFDTWAAEEPTDFIGTLSVFELV